jgi:anti-sigma factor RsiW
MTPIAPACLAVREALSAFIDGEVDDLAERRRIADHMGACPSCAQYLRTMRETIDLCRHAARPCLGDDCFQRAVSAARTELERRGLL